MAQPLPDTWADEVLRKGDLEGFERRISRRLGVSEHRFSSSERRVEGFEARFGKRLFRTFLLTNVLTMLGSFVLVLLARSV